MRGTQIIFLVLMTIVVSTSLATAQRSGLWPRGKSTSLKLVRFDVEAQIDHPLAEIRITQEFDNPSPIQLEAYYYYPVPQDATVTNLALWVNGKRREARVLERQKAREIYQGIVNQKRDPALVERLSDNLFRIRIFPVPPRGRQRVELRFVQPVEQLEQRHYRLRIPKPPGETSHALRLGVSLKTPKRLRRAWIVGYTGRLRRTKEGSSYKLPLPATQRSFTRDIEIHFEHSEINKKPVVLVQEQDDGSKTFIAELPHPPRSFRIVDRTALLLDTSMSMKARLKEAQQICWTLLNKLPERSHVQVLPFDILPRGSAASSTMQPASRSRIEELQRWILTFEANKGSAFIPVFRQALEENPQQIVLITDGASPGHQAEIQHLLRMIFDQRSVSVSVVLLQTRPVSADPQIDMLRDIARISGGLFIRAPKGKIDSALSMRLLTRTQKRSVGLSVKGSPVHLHLLADASPHRTLVAGWCPRAEKPAPRSLELILGQQRRYTIDLTRPRSELNRAVSAPWADAEIKRLMQRVKLFNEEDELRDQIISISKRHRVASEYTAFLVTETDADYLRPTSGQKWQHRVKQLGDDAQPVGNPNFHSTPEPHEILLIGIALMIVWFGRRQLAPGGGHP